MRPTREHATHNQQTYFVSSQTWGRRQLFKHERWAKLFLDTLFHYRGTAFLLHEFVLMPERFHLLITPLTSLEKAMQFIKGGFSHRAKVELHSNMEVWQKGFTDHRIRDASDYEQHLAYTYRNPVARKLCLESVEYLYCSASRAFELDDVPQRLKPLSFATAAARLQAAPLQDRSADIGQRLEAGPIQDGRLTDIPKAALTQSETRSEIGRKQPETIGSDDLLTVGDRLRKRAVQK